MRVYGVYRPLVPSSDFVCVLFEKEKEFYIQEEREFSRFEFTRVELVNESDVIPVQIKRTFEEESDQLVLGFMKDNEDILIGYKSELAEFLIEILLDSHDPFLKLKISQELNLNGLTKNLKLERDEYLMVNGLNVEFQEKENFLPIALHGEHFDIVLNNRLDYYRSLFEISQKLTWNDAVDTIIDSYKNEIRLEKFRFSLDDVFGSILQSGEYDSLMELLIQKNNATMSFYTEKNLPEIPNKNEGIFLMEDKIEQMKSYVKKINRNEFI